MRFFKPKIDKLVERQLEEAQRELLMAEAEVESYNFTLQCSMARIGLLRTRIERLRGRMAADDAAMTAVP